MILNKTRQTIYRKRFSLKNANKSCNKRLKYFKFPRKRNKAKTVMKKIALEDNIATKYIEYKQKY